MADLNQLIREGIFDIELGVANPRSSGVSAGEGAIGYATDNSRWVKVGAGDTDWEQILISTNGEFVANFEVADSTGLVLGEHVLGHVGGELRIGDGATTGGVAVAAELPTTILETVGSALIGGDKTGNARGAGAIDIQVSRNGVTRVASGKDSIVIGKNAIASGNTSLAIGVNAISSDTTAVAIGGATASGYAAIAIGETAQAAGYSSIVITTLDSGSSSTARAGQFGIAIGVNADATIGYNIAMGYNSTCSGYYGFGIGANVKNTASGGYFGEIGTWAYGGVRKCSVRMHPNGQVSLTIADTASAPTDGGATSGAESDGTLGRGMFAIQKNGTAVTLYYNNAGTIQSLSLGTLA